MPGNAELENVRGRGEDGSLVYRTVSGGFLATISPNTYVENLNANTTLSASDSGIIVCSITTSLPIVFSIPGASTLAGAEYQIYNGCNYYGAGSFQLQFATTNTAVGCGFPAITVGARLTLTQATSLPGDGIALYSTSSTTWIIEQITGTFTTS